MDGIAYVYMNTHDVLHPVFDYSERRHLTDICEGTLECDDVRWSSGNRTNSSVAKTSLALRYLLETFIELGLQELTRRTGAYGGV